MDRYRFGDDNWVLFWTICLPVLCMYEWVVRPWMERNKRGR
jgi:hypothetical protein